MPGPASPPLSSIRRIAYILLHRPSYVLGRFATVRDTYSQLHRLKDLVAGAGPLRIADLYHDAEATIGIAPSGHVLAARTAAEQAAEMRRQSYSLGPNLGAAAIAELRQCARTLPLHFNEADVGTYEELSQSPERRADLALATIRNAARLPMIRALAGDSYLYEAATRFLGYRPTEVSCWFFWSLANHLSDDERRAASQTIDYHYDVNGFNFLYINFYLLDTDAMNGAHALVAGSGRRKRLRHLLGSARLGDEEVRETYGLEAERLIEGPAGSGFLEDTSCYHKALAPVSADRLMLQFRYQ